MTTLRQEIDRYKFVIWSIDSLEDYVRETMARQDELVKEYLKYKEVRNEQWIELHNRERRDADEQVSAAFRKEEAEMPRLREEVRNWHNYFNSHPLNNAKSELELRELADLIRDNKNGTLERINRKIEELKKKAAEEASEAHRQEEEARRKADEYYRKKFEQLRGDILAAPSDYAPKEELISLLELRNCKNEAIGQLRTWLSQTPTDWQVRNRLIQILDQTATRSEHILLLKESLKFYPQNGELFETLACQLERNGQEADILPILLSTILLNPKNEWAIGKLIDLYTKSTNLDEWLNMAQSVFNGEVKLERSDANEIVERLIKQEHYRHAFGIVKLLLPDRLDPVPLLTLLGNDGRSVRWFLRTFYENSCRFPEINPGMTNWLRISFSNSNDEQFLIDFFIPKLIFEELDVELQIKGLKYMAWIYPNIQSGIWKMIYEVESTGQVQIFAIQEYRKYLKPGFENDEEAEWWLKTANSKVVRAAVIKAYSEVDLRPRSFWERLSGKRPWAQ